MLDIAPDLTSQLHTITSLVSPGYIDLRLASNGGQLTQRFYRVQRVIRNGVDYFPRDFRDTLIEGEKEVVYHNSTYSIVGDQLWLFPLDTATDVEFRYSFKPTPFTSLTDGMNVPFPEGEELAPIFLASAYTMAKGNAEDAGQLYRMYLDSNERLMSSIRRQYRGPTVPFLQESGVSHGGI